MIIWQLILQLAVLLSFLILLTSFIRQFEKSYTTTYVLGVVLIIFTMGFAMRLTTNEDIVNGGYYLTDISYLFTYLLFTAALILGQKKYWNIK